MENSEEPKKKRGPGAPKGHPQWKPPGGKGAPMGHPPYEGSGRPEIWTEEKINEIADYFIEYIDLPTSLYFKEFLVWLRQNKDIKLNKCCFPRFSEKNEKFRDAYEYAQLVQECKIVKGGLLKKFDSAMSKFMLCAVHGYTDKQTVEHQGKEIIQIINYSDTDLKTWNEQKPNKGE
jgi:hypothetical protein